VIALLAALTIAAAPAQPAVRYLIDYRFISAQPASHFGDVRVRVTGADADSVRFQLPTWYPGRYAIYNFAANVQDEAARCGDAAVPAVKTDKTTWVVRCPRGRAVELAYRVYWNDLTGSTSQIDSTHVNLNPGNVFPYVVGHKADPVTVRYEGPAGWRVLNGATVNGATVAEGNGMTPLGGLGAVVEGGDDANARAYRFPNYDVMIDHPTEISAAFTVDSFRVGKVLYRVLLHTDKDPGPLRARFVADVERITRSEVAMWGDPPTPSYTFMVHFLAGNGGDGMEHLTSTHISQPVSLADLADSNAYLPRLGVVAHEFFHTWNMKRLRARELGPWDYTRENYTTTLWIGEGITNYYGVRHLLRAGVWDSTRYLNRTAAAVRQLQARPARRFMSAQESSLSAWLFDAVPLRQKANLDSASISYYNKGELLGWLLDLDIRARTRGAKSLDDVMRLMWRRFWLAPSASYYLQGRGYTDADFLRAVNDVSGGDYGDFFRRYVSGTEELPYREVLAKVGLALTETDGRYALALEPGAPGAELGRAWLAGH
jgi:predicted metalloprotease with PDZ domain